MERSSAHGGARHEVELVTRWSSSRGRACHEVEFVTRSSSPRELITRWSLALGARRKKERSSAHGGARHEVELGLGSSAKGRRGARHMVELVTRWSSSSSSLGGACHEVELGTSLFLCHFPIPQPPAISVASHRKAPPSHRASLPYRWPLTPCPGELTPSQAEHLPVPAAVLRSSSPLASIREPPYCH
ncbi:hypothetical protein Droror1_Dr00000170 [Drosera rotundifolia]